MDAANFFSGGYENFLEERFVETEAGIAVTEATVIVLGLERKTYGIKVKGELPATKTSYTLVYLARRTLHTAHRFLRWSPKS